MTGQQIALDFPTCVLPGCTTHVTQPGDACGGCVEAFGPMLAHTEAPALTAAEVEARDAAVRDALRARAAQPKPAPDGPERKANQKCWMCEERRTCTRTPSGWECTACQEIQ